jgi:hypothetical protein
VSAPDNRHWWWEYSQREYRPINWDGVVRVLSQLADGFAKMAAASEPEMAPVAAAATLLGVRLDASPDEIRAALRKKMRDGKLHPDHGGDPEVAKRFTAASNLLIAHAKSRTP